MAAGNSMPAVYVEAEYSDGYVHREDDADCSPYVAGSNIFGDILNRRPEAEHGAMVRFSLIHPKRRIDIDWTEVPENARPIRYKHFERAAVNGNWIEAPQLKRVDFGYQYTEVIDDVEVNHQQIDHVL